MDAVQLRAQAAVYLKLAQEIKDKQEAARALSIALDCFQRARDIEEAERTPVEASGELAVRKSPP